MAKARKEWRKALPGRRDWRAKTAEEDELHRRLKDAQRLLEEAIKFGTAFVAKQRHTAQGRRATTAILKIRRAHALVGDVGWLTPLIDALDPDLSDKPRARRPAKEDKAKKPVPTRPENRRQARKRRKTTALRESKKRRGPRKVSHATT